jgi:hypothetical protein
MTLPPFLFSCPRRIGPRRLQSTSLHIADHSLAAGLDVDVLLSALPVQRPATERWQALYLAHQDRAAAVAQLERLADGAQDLMIGKAIPDDGLELLQQQLRDFIAAVK